MMKVVFVGAGNLATHFSKALYDKGFEITQIISRTENSAKSLAEKLNTKYTTKLEEIDLTSDLYILSVNDDSISEIAKQLNLIDKLIIHTSGSTNMSVLSEVSSNYGVIYPLQTFSKNKDVDFSKIPMFIEASNDIQKQKLLDIASKISTNVNVITSEQRLTLHIAAVFSCNFVNHLFAISEDILEQNNLSFDVMKPLIDGTIEKIKNDKPKNVQTGPAKRNDKKTLEKHLSLLSANPKYEEIYRVLSDSIINLYK